MGPLTTAFPLPPIVLVCMRALWCVSSANWSFFGSEELVSLLKQLVLMDKEHDKLKPRHAFYGTRMFKGPPRFAEKAVRCDTAPPRAVPDVPPLKMTDHLKGPLELSKTPRLFGPPKSVTESKAEAFTPVGFADAIVASKKDGTAAFRQTAPRFAKDRLHAAAKKGDAVAASSSEETYTPRGIADEIINKRITARSQSAAFADAKRFVEPKPVTSNVDFYAPPSLGEEVSKRKSGHIFRSTAPRFVESKPPLSVTVDAHDVSGMADEVQRSKKKGPLALAADRFPREKKQPELLPPPEKVEEVPGKEKAKSIRFASLFKGGERFRSHSADQLAAKRDAYVPPGIGRSKCQLPALGRPERRGLWTLLPNPPPKTLISTPLRALLNRWHFGPLLPLSPHASDSKS